MSSSSACSTTAKMTGISVAVTVGALSVLYWKRQDKKKLRRNLSFTSAYLAMGTYPEKAKYTEPIINATMYFDQLPSTEDIVEQAVQPFLAYDRLSMIPAKDKAGTMRPPSPPLDPRKLVRTIVVSKQEEIYDKIEEIFNDMLGDNPQRDDLPWWEFLRIEVRKGRCL